MPYWALWGLPGVINTTVKASAGRSAATRITAYPVSLARLGRWEKRGGYTLDVHLKTPWQINIDPSVVPVVAKAVKRLYVGIIGLYGPAVFVEMFPMTTFDEREDKYEKKFAHDAALQFKAEARRNKLLGLWAAGLMGKEGDDAQAYAKEVIKADLEEAGDEDVFRKVRADFDAAGVDQSDHQLRRQMDACMAEAMQQLQEEG